LLSVENSDREEEEARGRGENRLFKKKDPKGTKKNAEIFSSKALLTVMEQGVSSPRGRGGAERRKNLEISIW